MGASPHKKAAVSWICRDGTLRRPSLLRIGWGDLSRLGTGERSSAEPKARSGPNERVLVSQRGRRPDEVCVVSHLSMVAVRKDQIFQFPVALGVRKCTEVYGVGRAGSSGGGCP